MSSSTIDLDLEALYWLGEAPDEVLADFSQELILDEMVGEIYSFIAAYTQEYQAVPDRSVIELEFLKYNLQFEKPVTHLPDLVERLRDRYARRQAQQSVLEVGRAVAADPRSVGARMIEEGRRLDSILSSHRDIFDSNSIDKAIMAYHRRVATGRGPSLGFQELDDYFHGQEALTFLIGAPKSHKTWTGICSMIENVKKGKTVYWAGLEMPTEVYDWRVRCMNANIPFWKYLHGKMEPEDISKIKRASADLAQQGHFVIEKPDNGERSPTAIYSKARKAGASVIYIDQLQYCENSKGKAIGAINKTEDFFEVCNILKDLADIPIFVIHQFNRSILGNSDFPDMQQIKNSSAIEETATLALALYSNKAMKQDNVVQIGTLASRNYGHAIWELSIQMRQGCSLDVVDRVDI